MALSLVLRLSSAGSTAEYGLLAPSAFIPLAERTGIIAQIGDWVIDEACAQFSSWRESGVVVSSVSINASALQVRRGNLLGSLTVALQRWKVAAACLELEFTESVLLDDIQLVAELMDDLRTLGVKLSIDDFGTGYSSLS